MARPRARGLLVAALAIGSAAALALPALALGARVGQGASKQNGVPARLDLTLATGQVDSFLVNLDFTRGAPQTRGGSVVYPQLRGRGRQGASGRHR